MPLLVKIHTRLWLLFFLATIGLVGLAFTVPFYFPIYALSFVIPSLKGKEEFVLRYGIGWLMRLQPWFRGRVDLKLPSRRPGQGILLVSNHRSHLDVFILLSRIRGIRILARGNLMKIPVLGLYMRTSRQIPVERGRLDAWVRAMNEVKIRLGRGENVHVFPEMTRCPPGFPGVQNFAAAPFQAAIAAEAVVVPIVFRGTDEAWPKGFVGLNFRRKISAETLSPLRASDYASADALKSEVHRRINTALKT